VAVAAGRAVAVVMVAAASEVVPADHGEAAVAAVLAGEGLQGHGKH